MQIMEYIRKALRNPNFGKTNADKIASSVFLIGGVFTMWYELYHVMPTYQLAVSTQMFNYFMAAWCFTGALTNWYKLISTRTFAYSVELNDRKESDWRYCERCFQFSPPRCHHCTVCNVCVLKRDHHCWFAGCCIGFSNQRFYICMVVYIWLAALYSNVFNALYVYRVMGGFGLSSIFSLAFPHGAAVLGLVDFHQFCISVVSFIGFALLFLFSWLLQIQLTQMYHGQTKHERKQGITQYDLGWRKNVEEVLGHRYKLVLLWAWIPSQLLGDGVTFTKEAKDQ